MIGLLSILVMSFTVWLVFPICLFVFMIDSHSKVRFYEFFGRRLFKLKRIVDEYELKFHV